MTCEECTHLLEEIAGLREVIRSLKVQNNILIAEKKGEIARRKEQAEKWKAYKIWNKK